MADGIADFNPRDGLEPLVVQKLNNNFQSLLRMFMPLAINMVAQSEEPEPRTDETLWYDTDNGDLYIWAQGVDPLTGQPDGNWSWKKLDLNMVVIEDHSPIDPFGPGYTPSEGQFLWYDTSTQKLWIWQRASYYQDDPGWETLESIIYNTVYWGFMDSDGSWHQDFVDAVHDAMNEQHS